MSCALPVLQFDFGNYMESLPETASSPTQSVGATRKLMEEVARESVVALRNVTVRAGSWVSGLQLAEAHGTIQGRLPLLHFRTASMHGSCQLDVFLHRKASSAHRHMHP